MLEDCLIDSRSSARARKPGTLVVSVLVHGALAIGLIVIPLFQIPLLPNVPVIAPLTPAVAIAPRAVELVPVGGGPSRSSSTETPAIQVLTAPIAIPNRIAEVRDSAPAVMIGDISLPGIGNGTPGSPDGALPFGNPNAVAPPAGPPQPPPVRPPAPPPAPPAVMAPVRVGSIEPSKLLFSVQPVYPRLAVIARVEGAVVLEAVITRDGLVDKKRLKVVSGHNMLSAAAVEAVEQWRYKPTVLNGERVEILANITVNFTLNRQ
jgi:protein TonB